MSPGQENDGSAHFLQLPVRSSSCHRPSQRSFFSLNCQLAVILSLPIPALVFFPLNCQFAAILSPHFIFILHLLYVFSSHVIPSLPIACSIFTLTCQLSLNAAHKSITYITLHIHLYRTCHLLLNAAHKSLAAHKSCAAHKSLSRTSIISYHLYNS